MYVYMYRYFHAKDAIHLRRLAAVYEEGGESGHLPGAKNLPVLQALNIFQCSRLNIFQACSLSKTPGSFRSSLSFSLLPYLKRLEVLDLPYLPVFFPI